MDYAKIIESLKGLIREDTSAEDIEKITGAVKDIETAKTEKDDLVIKHEELRQKYIKALTQSAFKDDSSQQPQETQPKTLEECIAEQLAKGGK